LDGRLGWKLIHYWVNAPYYVEEEVMSRLHSSNAFYHSVQNLLLYLLPHITSNLKLSLNLIEESREKKELKEYLQESNNRKMERTEQQEVS
jgi:hypothetical protein